VELQDYLVIIRKRWASILLVTLLATATAIVATVTATPMYAARSQVFVSVRTTSGTTSADLFQGSSFTQRQVKSYTDLVTSPRVLTPVIEYLDLSTTPDELASAISAGSPLDTVLINITATNADPQVASDIANAVADSLAKQVTELEKPTNGPSPVEISTVRAATPPANPSSPNAKLNLALGLLLGLALGFGIAVLREVLDTRIRTTDDIRKVTDASVMSAMAHDDDAAKHPLIVHTAPHSLRAEAFRRLRTNLQFLDVADRLESIVVTSSVAGEGKSTVAINLAITLADAGSRVALVDADLRRPSIAEYMGLEGRVGLTTVLIGQATLDDVMQPWGDGKLHVLPSGQIPPNPSEMVGSHAMAWLLGELVKSYDVVIIDTPPLLPVTDAAILARLTGGALVIAGANRLNRANLADSLESLEAVGARVLGIVLNHLARKQTEGYYYYYGPDHEHAGERRTTQRREHPSQGTAHAGRKRMIGKVARPFHPTGQATPPAGSGTDDTSEDDLATGSMSSPSSDEAELDELLGPPQPAAKPSRWLGDPIS
jgi:succinoglycan biosynthesis transport protein ExoP